MENSFDTNDVNKVELINNILKLVETTPNDYDLGQKTRKVYYEYKDKMISTNNQIYKGYNITTTFNLD